MIAVGVEAPVHAGPEQAAPAAPASARRGRLQSFVRGRVDDPGWVRPALLLLLAVTAVLYLSDLGASGWANSFYSAAVQAGTKSWKAFFFGSFDASNFITVDKSPGALWIMELSARVFGVNSWSILVPNALEGVATVGFLYATVRRWFSPAAGLLAGAVVALTPVAALMFRFNNPDAFLVLLLTLSAYSTVRAIEGGRARWIMLAGALVGFGFLAKMLQAFLVVPAIGLAYLVAAPGSVTRRVKHLALGGVALVVAAGWWVMAVVLTPAANRPYIGGSQNDSLWNLVFGYNGFGRLTGNETGSVGGGGAGGTSMWGATGITRLFGADMGSQISWLLPAALLLLVGGFGATARARRTDRTRAALLIWGGWLLVTGAAFSFGKGIIHPYYTVALAPAIGGAIATGAYALWPHRSSWLGRGMFAAVVASTSIWSAVLLHRSPAWFPALRIFILIVGLGAAAGLLAWPYVSRLARAFLLAGALTASLAAPAAYTLDTVVTPHSGAIPTAGPAVTAAFGRGPGGAGGFGGGGGGGGGFGPGANGAATGGTATGRFGPGGFGGPAGPGGGQTSTGGPATGRSGGTAGGLLNGSNPSSTLVAYLKAGSSKYTWVAATTGANEAAGYQLATGLPVMAIGGFNGTDPAPTLAQFEKLVSEGRIHYYISGAVGGGGGFGGGGAGSGSSDSSEIASWVESHFTSKTVGGVTVYDLSSSSSTSTSTGAAI